MNQDSIEHHFAPVARFAGHTAASVTGFVCLAVISLVPIGFLSLLKLLGIDELSQELRHLKTFIVYADIAMFGFSFLLGAIEFAVAEFVTVRRRIRALVSDTVAE